MKRLLFLGLGIMSFLSGFLLIPYLAGSRLSLATPETTGNLANLVLFASPVFLALSILGFVSHRYYTLSKGALRRTIRALSAVLLLIGLGSIGCFSALQTQWYLKTPWQERESARLLQNETAVTYDMDFVYRGSLESFDRKKHDIFRAEVPNSFVRDEFGGKAAGWLASNQDSVFLVQGDGSLLQTKKSVFTSFQHLETHESVSSSFPVVFTSLPSNLDSVISDEARKWGKAGVRGIHATDKKLFLSITHKISVDGRLCYGTSIVSANLAIEQQLFFDEIFKMDECPDGNELELWESGGAIISTQEPNPKIITAVGTYRDRTKAQEMESVLGSILEFPIDGGDVKTLAKGVRNPQGIIELGNQLIFIEQGPNGGDEINQLDINRTKVQNFGWPISSAGSHYGSRLQPGAPLYDSHVEFGFQAPKFEWVPSVAPSGLTASLEIDSDFVVSTLGNKPTEGDMSLLFFSTEASVTNKFALVDMLHLGFRARNIIDVSNSHYLVLSDSGDLYIVTKGRNR